MAEISDLSNADIQTLLLMAERPDDFQSAAKLRSTTMDLRRLTDTGHVEMSLSASGVPFYRITDIGMAAIFEAGS